MQSFLFLIRPRKTKGGEREEDNLYAIEDKEIKDKKLAKEAKKAPDKYVNFLAPRSPEVYSRKTQELIDLVTIDKSVNPVGSQKYKVHRYPGDIDIFEQVKVCCSLEEAQNKIVQHFQDLARNIYYTPNVYFGDFKAGLDHRYDINIGELDIEGKPINYNPRMIRLQVENLYEDSLITKKELEEFNEAIKPKPNREQWEELNDLKRRYYIVRWNLDEILRGYKLIGPPSELEELTLAEAITHKTICKIDIWAPVMGNFMEITNFFLLVLQQPLSGGKYKDIPINIELGNIYSSLISDIKHYGSKAHRNSLKFAKRIWTLCSYINETETMRKLYPLFVSGAGILNQINSEIEVLVNLLEKIPRPPIDLIKEQVDRFKFRISQVYEFDLNEKVVNRLIDEILLTDNKSKMIENLEKIVKHLKKYIESYSNFYLNRIGINKTNMFDYLLN
jgi:hypothetical protein